MPPITGALCACGFGTAYEALRRMAVLKPLKVTIENAENWKFLNTRIQTADGSHVTLKDSRGVTGLPAN